MLRLDAAEQRRAADSDEVARLRSESALKDLDITNLQRRKAELKEDVEMLNIALDSKQQELELASFPYGSEIVLTLCVNVDETEVFGQRRCRKHTTGFIETYQHHR